MSAAEVLTMAKAEGVTLAIVGDRLTWEADHQPPDDLLSTIKAHKQELIKALTPTNKPAEQEPQQTDLTAATSSQEWITARDQYHNHLMTCRACHAPTGRYCAEGEKLRRRYQSTERLQGF